MNSVKAFTQSITQILVGLLTVGFLFAFAQIIQFTGLLQWVDGLYRVNLPAFWVGIIITREIYSFGSLFGILGLIDRLTEKKFFWFAPDSKEEDSPAPPSRDKSKDILAVFIMAGMACLVGELLIRIFTLSVPPFMAR